MKEFLFGRINEKLKENRMMKNAKSLAAVTHTHTHCLLVNSFCVFFNTAKLKFNRVFNKGSIAPLSFWHGGAGLSFVALFWKKGVCFAASGGKTRHGPFISFMNDGVYRNYEGSCV